VTKRLYSKYHIEKVDGTPIDEAAEYFVLRLDTDRHARVAALAYADSIAEEDRAFASEIRNWVQLIALEVLRR